MIKRLFLTVFTLLLLLSCASTNNVPKPEDCGVGNSTFKQKSRVIKNETCLAINPNLFRNGKKKIWGKTDVFWPKNTILTVKFLNGSSKQQDLMWKQFEIVNSLSSLKYIKSQGNTNIRVLFNPADGHWSYIGIWNKQIPQTQRTMNIGLVGNEGAEEWNRVGIHEILHSAGFYHELQHPYYSIPWNVPAVLEYYKRTQGWTDAEIHAQVLDRADPSNFSGTDFDKKSIMCYPVSPELTKNGFSVGWNYKLSPCDVAQIQKIYPISK